MSGVEAVGVVVLDLDQPSLTARCLKSLASGSLRPCMVVLVENGQEMFGLGSELDLANLPIIILRPGCNLGCAGGRNLGLNYLARNTSLSTFIVLDNDVIVPHNFIEQLVNLEPPAPLEVVAPIIYDLITGAVWSSGGSVDPDGTVHQLSDEHFVNGQAKEVDWAPGACLIMSREAWIRVGAFDAWMSFLFEDIDWCRRVRELGGRILVEPRLCLLHESHQSLGGRWSPARVHLWARNGSVFIAGIARAGIRPTVKWLWTESMLVARDFVTGKASWASARMLGLGLGMLEAFRRRRRTEQRPGGHSCIHRTT